MSAETLDDLILALPVLSDTLQLEALPSSVHMWIKNDDGENAFTILEPADVDRVLAWLTAWREGSGLPAPGTALGTCDP